MSRRVLINETPKRLFAMVHELKHHFRGRAILECGQIPCGDYNTNRDIEIGAEVFAAEFIFLRPNSSASRGHSAK